MNYRSLLAWFLTAFYIHILGVWSGYCSEIFVSGYGSSDSGMTNVIYKIDLNNSQIADSIVLPICGEFFGQPVSIMFGGYQHLVPIIHRGIAGKNSPALGRCDAYYFLINRINFELLYYDSLPASQILRFGQVAGDTLRLVWMDESAEYQGIYEGYFTINPNDLHLLQASRRSYDMENEPHQEFHTFEDPMLVNKSDTLSHYWDLVNGSQVVLFSVDRAGNVTNQIQLGSRNEASIVIGYDPHNDLIYSIVSRFQILSRYPAYTSPDYIHNVVNLLSPADYSVINSISINPGGIYFSNEAGTAQYIDGLLVYYYSGWDDYRRFDPAYLFIFDTRTNEASWLRVGWR